MEAREVDEICPGSERAACAFRMARAGAATRESFQRLKNAFMPLVRQTDVADSPRGGLSL